MRKTDEARAFRDEDEHDRMVDGIARHQGAELRGERQGPATASSQISPDDVHLLHFLIEDAVLDAAEPAARRVAALEAYRAGNYAHAELLLRSLIADRFEVPSTHCHLGRLLLFQDRFRQAWTETAAAWEHRADAASYVFPRILWLALALLYTSPTEAAGMSSAPVILGRLKTALAREGAHMEWTMDPVLAHLQSKLLAEQHQFLAALVAALSDATNLAALEQLPAWRDAQAEPLG